MRRVERLMDGWTFTDGQGQTAVLDLPHTWNGKEIQAVNGKRKDAIAAGMSLEEAMQKYQ
ncbi:MAG: hypothetical protein IKI99_06255 [Firmicutes bacterium]|nr:hypothetical protein [Bacillota bacterium]